MNEQRVWPIKKKEREKHVKAFATYNFNVVESWMLELTMVNEHITKPIETSPLCV